MVHELESRLAALCQITTYSMNMQLIHAIHKGDLPRARRILKQFQLDVADESLFGNLKTVYVSINEGPQGGGGFDWFNDVVDAVEDHKHDRYHAPIGSRLWCCSVDVPERLTDAEITDYIGKQLDDLEARYPAYIVKQPEHFTGTQDDKH